MKNEPPSTDNVGSVGIVKPCQVELFNLPERELNLTSGATLAPVTIQYETYGQLNAMRDNAVLLCHALSGDAHAAGRHAPEDKEPGWWDSAIGPGKAFDTNRYFVICSNFIGGCKGSSGPSSIDPATGAAWGLTFPLVTIEDMVAAQKGLIDYLGISRLLAVAGGSMGGMQALEWGVRFPDAVETIIPLATTHRLSAQGIAFNEVGRQAIYADPLWRQGDYYNGERPNAGLSIARMIGHITYLSEASMHRKFGRNLQGKTNYDYSFAIEFQVESYLRHQGEKFVQRFDANSYLYITKAMDYFNLAEGFPSLRDSLTRLRAKTLLIGFSSDWLFPTGDMREIGNALRANGADVTYLEIKSDAGHDAFLLETEDVTRAIRPFLHRAQADWRRRRERAP